MPFADAEGAKIYYEESGSGTPILFLHEFAGDHRSWEGQVRFFSRTHRCIVTAARGYPPSGVQEDESAYGQDRPIADALSVLDHLDIDRAVVIGLSMGAYTALRIALHHPDRIIACVPASGGAGSPKDTQAAFVRDAQATADRMLKSGEFPVDGIALGPTRTQLKRKDPRGWSEFRQHLAEHSVVGSAFTLRRVQAARPSLYDFEAELRTATTPVLLMVGDEDEPCLDVNLFLKRTMPSAGLAMFERCGHLLNLEEPGLFNARITAFLQAVENEAWPLRDRPDQVFGGIGLNIADDAAD